MTIAAGEPPRRGFQPGLLLYDTRYRSVTIQVVALLVLTALLAFLGYNVVQNLRALDKEFEFSFLWRRAGYDISQALIPYTNNDTHARAALVGILNTLLVAGLGILLATVVGVIAGVLRLSKNWLVGRLMTVYVEVFRNVPLLLWIILVYAVLSESTPQPRDFAGEEPAASMVLGLVAFTNRGTYIPWPVWGEGASVLLLVLLLSVLGVWAGGATRWRGARPRGATSPSSSCRSSCSSSPSRWPSSCSDGPSRSTCPRRGASTSRAGQRPQRPRGPLARALALHGRLHRRDRARGHPRVSSGQTEAAYSLGLRPGRTTRLVVLPQALRVIVPPLISQYLNLTKNSSLAVAVGYADVRSTLGGVTMNQTARELECMLLLGVFYLVVSLAISGVLNVYNARIALKER
jgi:general L-amino acid transport system permease protein